MNKLGICLGKGRLAPKSYKVFAECGYPCDDIERELTATGKLSQNQYEGKRATFFVHKADGLLAAVEKGTKAAIGIVGEDSKLEYEFRTKRGTGFTSFRVSDVFEFPKMKFVIAGRPENEEEFFKRLAQKKFLEIVTSYPAITQEYFAQKYPDFQQIFLDLIYSTGETELLAGGLDLAIAAFELVETGKSLVKNGLIPYACPTQEIPVLGIVNNGAAAYNSEVRDLAERVQEGI